MGYRRREPEFPKPFDFVPFSGRPEKGRKPGHEAFHNLSGELAYEIHVETPLHVSSGNYALTEDLGLAAKNVVRDVYRVKVDGEPRPAIPGSTLKGAVRAVVEAVTNSCLGVTRVNRRDLPQDVSWGCKPPDLCPACGLFGAMSRLGRVSFGDAVFAAGEGGIIRMPALYRPRPNQGRAYRDRSGRYKGRKFYYHGRPQPHKEGTYVEALKPGSVLPGRAAFSGLTAAELGLLLFGLGLDGSFQLALGGGKPVALGRVRVAATELRLRQRASFTAYDGGDVVWDGEALPGQVTHYLQQAEGLILAAQRDELRRILHPDNDRDAPTGVY